MLQLQPGDKVGRYEIRYAVGWGTFATVYLGYDPELARNVAIKLAHDAELVRNAESESTRENIQNPANLALLNEARVLGQLQHPAILSIFDIGQIDGLSFLVLEFLEGGDLESKFAREVAPLSADRIVEIFASTAEALDYLHRRGYLHRDIKAREILLDINGQPRLAGFEIAQCTTEVNSGNAGTPIQLALEQASNSAELAGTQTDIWCLGVTLYEALTGQRPYYASSAAELQKLILTTEPAPPSIRNPAVSLEVDRICRKCFAVNTNDRYRDAAALAADLRQALQPRKQQRVFVSHSTQDREFVEREIINQLEANGIKTWYSKVDIQSSAEWERSILRGLDSCDWFLIVMSTRSAASEWVKDELHWAIEKRPKKIIPVLIEDCNLRDFHIRMARIQYVDFRNPSRESRAQLLELLTADSA